MDIEKEKRAIQYLRSFEPEEEPYYLCYSGGKDSDAIRILAQLAGVKHECKHNLTTVDAPETVRYVRETIGKENINYPKESMWQLIVRKRMPPTRIARYCCEVLKERGGEGRLQITGVRWDESRKRKENAGIVRIIGKEKTMKRKAIEDDVNFLQTPIGGVVLSTDNAKERRFVEYCYRTTNTTINPIVDWTDRDVWEFLNHYGCESNPLYQCGFDRIGCIGCPLAGGKRMKAEFARYPKYKEAYIRAFDRMLEKRKADGLKSDRNNWINGEQVMRWWVGDDPNQITIDDYLKMTGEI